MAKIYLNLPGCKGDVTTANYEGCIECNSMEIGAYRSLQNIPGRMQDRDLAPPHVQEIRLSKEMCCASLAIFKKICATPTSTTEPATLHLVQTGNEDAWKIELHDPIVGHYELRAIGGGGDALGGGGSKPTESFSIYFTKIDCRCVPHDAQNQATQADAFEYDLATLAV